MREARQRHQLSKALEALSDGMFERLPRSKPDAVIENAAGVAQAHAQGNLIATRKVGKILSQAVIDVQQALFVQHQNQGGGEGLGYCLHRKSNRIAWPNYSPYRPDLRQRQPRRRISGLKAMRYQFEERSGNISIAWAEGLDSKKRGLHNEGSRLDNAVSRFRYARTCRRLLEQRSQSTCVMVWGIKDETRFVLSSENRSESEATPQKMVTMAEEALQRGESKHAARYLAPALALDPMNADWLHLFQRITASVEDPLSLFDTQSRERYFADEALRALTLHRLCRTAEALDVLFEVHRVRPDIPYITHWALEWLEEPNSLGEVDAAAFNKLLHCFSPYPELWDLSAFQLEGLQRIVSIYRELVELEKTDSATNYLMSAVLRKTGYREEALDLAHQYHEDKPGWLSAVAVAANLQKMGRHEEAVPFLEEAQKERPEDLVFYLELAETCAEAGRYADALRWCKFVLDQNKNHAQALAVATWCRIKVQGTEEEYLNDLRELAASNALAGRYFNRFTPYHGFLPEPVEALARIFSRLWNNMKGRESELSPGMARAELKYMESPSNLVVFELWRPDLLAAQVGWTPDPDPRYPAVEVDYLLWHYEGMVPEPALPEPHEAVAEMIADLSRKPYDAEQNMADAAYAALELGVARVSDILATVIYPPPPPEGMSPMAWVQRVQLTAVRVLAAIDRGWEDSVRRKVLVDLALGPMDWVKIPVLMVLARFAAEMPESREEVHALFRAMHELIPRQGGCCYTHALYYLWSGLDGAGDDEKAWAWQQLDAWMEEQQNAGDNEL